MSKKILLMDTYSTIHVGNGALLDNTIKLCKEAFGECEFHIISLDVETNKIRYKNLYNPMFGNFWLGKGLVGKLLWAIKQTTFMLIQIINENTLKLPSSKLVFNKDQKDALDVIEKCDICVSCSGEVIGDTFYQALPFWLFTYWISIKKGKKFILFPQSIGPFKMNWTRWLVKTALKNASLLVGRDKSSYEALLSLGFDKTKVMFVPDVAIQQEVGTADIHKYFNNEDKKVIGITISKPPLREMGQQIDFVAEVGTEIEKLDASIYKILIMPSNYIRNGISADYALCLKLKDKLSDKFEVSILENRAYFPDEYTSLLSQLEFFISTRMHVAILATSVYIPTIAINTQHKIRGYMQNIDFDNLCVDYRDINTIYQLSQDIVKNRKTIVEKLKVSNEKLKEEHKVFIERLKEVI